MKILSIGSHYLSESFRKAGIDLCAIVPGYMAVHPDDVPFEFYENVSQCSDFIEQKIESFKPDLIFQGDHSGPLIHAGLEKYSIPKVWYAVDVHLHHNWYKHYAVLFDKVFCAQKNYVDIMSTYTPDVEWLPVFYLGAHTNFVPWTQRKHFISFVGSMDGTKNPQRVALFDQIKRLGIEVNIISGPYEPVYSISKIVINQSVANDLNLRFFEAAGCGALLITDRLTHSMTEILIPDEDYLVYSHGNITELIEKINWVRHNDEAAEAMARRAQSKIIQNHLEIHRATRIVEWLFNRVNDTPTRETGVILSHLAWVYDSCSELSIPGTVTEFFRKKADEMAIQAINYSTGKYRALLILAEQAFHNGQYQVASETISQIDISSADKELEKRYFTLQMTIEFLKGKKDSALRIVAQLINEYPEDSDLLQIQGLFMK
jgi:glycosyltransferase involved in cell wall biosynthesis